MSPALCGVDAVTPAHTLLTESICRSLGWVPARRVVTGGGANGLEFYCRVLVMTTATNLRGPLWPERAGTRRPDRLADPPRSERQGP